MNNTSKRVAQLLILLSAALVLPAASGEAQSLGELSRQERARKAGQRVKEFTNDDIPPATLTGTPSAASPAAGAAAGAADAAKPGAATTADAKPADAPAEKSPAEVEKEYRDKAAKLRETIGFEERRLDVLQRELNLAQQQYYSDPNQALREQYSRDDINKRTAEIEAQKAAVEKAKQAVTDLEEELRKKNLPIGWAR